MITVKKRFSFLALLLVVILALGGTVLAQPTMTTQVAGVDKYGNLTLDLLTQALLDAGFEFGDLIQVEIAGTVFQAPLSPPTAMLMWGACWCGARAERGQPM